MAKSKNTSPHPQIGRISQIRRHGETVDALRHAVNHAMWPRGGLDYPARVWRQDRLLGDLREALQSWLSLYSGVRCAGITPDLADYLEDMYREALAELMAEVRGRPGAAR